MTINGQTAQGFLARADATTGMAQQVRTIPATVDLNDLAVDGNNVLLVGNVRSALNLGTCSVTPSGTGNDGLVVMFTGSNLACSWAKNLGSSTSNEDAFVSSAASFGNGAGWVISGSFEGSLSGLTSNSLGSMGLFDAYAARLALDGTHQWSFRYGGANSENASAISTTPDGSVVFVGSFNGSISFGAHTVNGTLNAYATRMSPSLTNPTHEWAVSLGGSEADTPWGVATAADGSVYLTSSFSGMTTVGEEALSAQQIDHWIAALVR